VGGSSSDDVQLGVFSLERKHWTRGELTAMQGMATLVEGFAYMEF